MGGTMIELTDAELDRVYGGAGYGVNTASLVQTEAGEAVTESPVYHAKGGLDNAAEKSPSPAPYPLGRGHLTAAAASNG